MTGHSPNKKVSYRIENYRTQLQNYFCVKTKTQEAIRNNSVDYRLINYFSLPMFPC